MKNKQSWILFVIFMTISVFLVTQCKPADRNTTPEWRYEVHGYVLHNGQKHDAIWYTDTIEIGENYLRYENSDGTEVVIPSPYVLIDHKYDTKKTQNTDPFH